ncbi:hypothetical protein PMKS-001303 [Pichia membranifaciens]|uniref:Uncharacterized protein n=1 Tax=Pichia membranifaciens TaxID=4926 RepID=A0A1Q2YEA5_9ASCO|nr:hypothetical protein PMKS-001303 [Pichia membranifaciens]
MNPVVAPISSRSVFNGKDQESSKSVFSQAYFSERPTKVAAVSQQKESKPALDEDALIRQYIRESANGTIPSSINGMSGLNLNSEERMFYNAFVNGFIVSISNQLAHQKLLPGSIFVPTAMFDPLIQKLCMTCGASFLYRCSAGNDKDLLLKVKESNSLIVKELVHRLDEMPIMETREWILIYFTLQNNRQKFVYEGRHSQTINLISGVQAIKMWLETKKKDANTKAGEKIEELSHPTVADAAPCTPSQNQKPASQSGKRNDHYSLEYNHEGDICSIEEFTEAESYILLDKLVDKTNLLKSINGNHSDSMILSPCEAPQSRTGHMVDMLEIEAKMLLSSFSYADKVKKAAEVTAFERTLLETFIFNYSGTLLTIDKSLVGCLTSPFDLFDLIAPLLFVPIYKCAVPWMNNPTAGAALPMIELQAKIIWLSFKEEFDQRDLKIIHTIQKLAQYYTRPILPDEVWRSYPKNVSKKLAESCYVSEIVAKGVYLFSMKILDRSLSEGDEKVQEIVDSMFKILECISMHSQTSVIAKWSFLVIGCAILNEDQRVKLKKRLIGFVEALKTGSLRTSLIFLEAVWENGVGLNALFIEKYLDLLVI